MIDDDKKKELKDKLDSFIRKNRPSVLVRDRYDIRYEISGGGFSLFEVAPGKGEIVIFRAKYCCDKGGWKISMPHRPSMHGLGFMDDIDDILKLAAQNVYDEDLSWALMARNERMFTYDEFMRITKTSQNDAILLAGKKALDFCVQVPDGMDVYSFHKDSVPDMPNDKWSREKGRYYKNFTEMKYGPTLQSDYRYLVISPADAIELISGKTAKIAKFYHAYVLGERLLTSGNSYRVSPSAIPLFNENGGLNKDDLFFGLNLRGTKYSFNEGAGYTPCPQGVVFNRGDVFVKGLVLKDFVRSSEYEKIYNRNLGKSMKDFGGGNGGRGLDSLHIAMEVAINSLLAEKVNLSSINLKAVIGEFEKYVGREGSDIVEISKKKRIIRWGNNSHGVPPEMGFGLVSSRLARIKKFLKKESVQDFDGLVVQPSNAKQ